MTVLEMERLIMYLPKEMLIMMPLSDTGCVIPVSKAKTRVIEVQVQDKIMQALVLEPSTCNTEIQQNQREIAISCLDENKNNAN